MRAFLSRSGAADRLARQRAHPERAEVAQRALRAVEREDATEVRADDEEHNKQDARHAAIVDGGLLLDRQRRSAAAAYRLRRREQPPFRQELDSGRRTDLARVRELV